MTTLTVDPLLTVASPAGSGSARCRSASGTMGPAWSEKCRPGQPPWRARSPAASVSLVRSGTVTWGTPVETNTVTVRTDRHLRPRRRVGAGHLAGGDRRRRFVVLIPDDSAAAGRVSDRPRSGVWPDQRTGSVTCCLPVETTSCTADPLAPAGAGRGVGADHRPQGHGVGGPGADVDHEAGASGGRWWPRPASDRPRWVPAPGRGRC